MSDGYGLAANPKTADDWREYAEHRLARIEELTAERDKAREECGHQRAMKESIRNELDGAIRQLMAAKERTENSKRALLASGYFTAEQVTDDIAPRIIELMAAWTPSGSRGTAE